MTLEWRGKNPDTKRRIMSWKDRKKQEQILLTEEERTCIQTNSRNSSKDQKGGYTPDHWRIWGGGERRLFNQVFDVYCDGRAQLLTKWRRCRRTLQTENYQELPKKTHTKSTTKKKKKKKKKPNPQKQNKLLMT